MAMMQILIRMSGVCILPDLPGKYEIEKDDSPQQHTVAVGDPQSSKYHSEDHQRAEEDHRK